MRGARLAKPEKLANLRLELTSLCDGSAALCWAAEHIWR